MLVRPPTAHPINYHHTVPFKEKAIVRHRLRPEWGIGRVLLRRDDFVQIDFAEGGLKKLKTAIADDHLEAATEDDGKPLRRAKKAR